MCMGTGKRMCMGTNKRTCNVPQNFVKYNGVLRGLQSDSAFLKKAMVALCCPESIAEQYAAGSVAFEEACRSLNKYTTTLHGINSAIIKMGKLTVASKAQKLQVNKLQVTR